MKFSNLLSTVLLAASVHADVFYYPSYLIETILSLKVDIDLDINLGIINTKCHPYINNLDYYLCIEALHGYPSTDLADIKVNVADLVDVKAKVDLGGDPDIKAKVKVADIVNVKPKVDL